MRKGQRGQRRDKGEGTKNGSGGPGGPGDCSPGLPQIRTCPTKKYGRHRIWFLSKNGHSGSLICKPPPGLLRQIAPPPGRARRRGNYSGVEFSGRHSSFHRNRSGGELATGSRASPGTSPAEVEGRGSPPDLFRWELEWPARNRDHTIPLRRACPGGGAIDGQTAASRVNIFSNRA